MYRVGVVDNIYELTNVWLKRKSFVDHDFITKYLGIALDTFASHIERLWGKMRTLVNKMQA